jgi:hypothetical protein
MTSSAPKMTPDFWGFLNQNIAKLDEEAAKVQSETDMKVLLDRWLHSENGTLAKLKDHPFFAMAKPSAQRVFLDTMGNRVRQLEREWKEIWRSLYES